MCIYIYIYNHNNDNNIQRPAGNVPDTANFRTKTFFRARIFEPTFRSHCAKKLDGALRTSISFV